MNDLTVQDNYKSVLIEKQIKIFSYYLVTTLVFMGIFCSILLLEKFQSYRQPTIEEPSTISSDIITIKQGNTLHHLLSAYNLSYSEIVQIIKAAKPTLDLSYLKVGQNIEIKYDQPSSSKKILQTISAKISPKEKIIIEKVGQQYQTRIIPIIIKTALVAASGTITENVINSALQSGIPLKNIMEFISYYSYEIDFQRDLRTGDKFNIIYKTLTSEDDSKTTTGKTVFANLILSGKQYKMYRFKPDNGHEDFFNENNSSVKKPLLKTPVQAARISSKFGLRKHPILGYSLMHRGVDFAAPSGTPIYAAGNGIVVEMGHKGSYGRYIKVKHNSELYTAYAHARGFARGLKRGSKVSQGSTIAYVGASGRASGPHLHYEIIHRGKQIDPLKFKVPSYIKLIGKNLEDFKQRKLELDALTVNS